MEITPKAASAYLKDLRGPILEAERQAIRKKREAARRNVVAMRGMGFSIMKIADALDLSRWVVEAILREDRSKS